MAMSRPQPINVFMVAAASAALHAGAAAIMVPVLSYLFLYWGGGSTGIAAVKTENAMVLAVIAPAISGAFGFLAGAIAGMAHNMFVRSQRSDTIKIRQRREVRAASFGNVA